MSILTKAEEIINGQRAKDYGDAKENHIRIAKLWEAYTGVEFEPEDVAIMMILLKIARHMENGYHEDTTVDIAGYAGVLEKMQLPKEQRYASKPRQWNKLEDVPNEVVVAANNGCKWRFNPEYRAWMWRSSEGIPHSQTGPFTEVIEEFDV